MRKEVQILNCPLIKFFNITTEDEVYYYFTAEIYFASENLLVNDSFSLTKKYFLDDDNEKILTLYRDLKSYETNFEDIENISPRVKQLLENYDGLIPVEALAKCFGLEVRLDSTDCDHTQFIYYLSLQDLSAFNHVINKNEPIQLTNILSERSFLEIHSNKKTSK